MVPARLGKKGEMANAKGVGDSEGMEREERGEREWKESKVRKLSK